MGRHLPEAMTAMEQRNEFAPGPGSASVQALRATAYTVPTDFPESDGTLEWDSTTIVLVEAQSAKETGLGYTYVTAAAARVVDDVLAECVLGLDPMDVPAAYERMWRAVRNQGRPGIASCAISAVDAALWDLKSRLLGVPLVDLLGVARDSIPVYGSGGFTSYPVDRLCRQLAVWAGEGIRMVKMKVGREPGQDIERVRKARGAIGPDADLFVDANGAYTRKQALEMAEAFSEFEVRWFEEPVSSDDLEGLRLIRDRAPAAMDVAAGEYGYEPFYFRRMLEAGAVDVLQADMTRCGGVTGFLGVAELCRAHGLPLSAHTAPALHTHVCCAAPNVAHVEYFYDHVRIEAMLFDGVPQPVSGRLAPDRSRPGMGLRFRREDAARYAVYP